MEINRCCGCTACAAACPRNAVTMKQNQQGFYVPHIELALCVHCGRCDQVCPIDKQFSHTDFEPLFYACSSKNACTVEQSSSGGMFWTLAQKVLSDGGKVYGCAWSGNLEAVHVCAETEEELRKLLKSKYVQSNLDGVYRQVKKHLDTGIKVLFSGTPCQVAGIKGFLGRDYDNLYLVDLICHGVPSSKILKKYIEETEQEFGTKIACIDFRDKRNGWRTLSINLKFQNSENVCRKASDDPYYKAFLSNLILMEICGSCRFNCMPRNSDITLGDFWGIEKTGHAEFSGDGGVSCAIINNEKGRTLFREVVSNIKCSRVGIDDILAGNPFLNGHCNLHPRRSQFFDYLDKQSFAQNVQERLKLTKREYITEIGRYKTGQLWHKMQTAAELLRQAIERQQRKRLLKVKEFTIISNNCWGSFVYQKFGLPYTSPTVGLYILGDDFVKFCSDWQGYLAKDLEFIPWEVSRYYPELRDKKPYPVARLGDIEIYFMHYGSEEEAREKWNRRKARINPNCMVFKLSQREYCSREDVERFLALPLEHKICFSYDDVPGAVVIPELRELVGDEWPLVSERFDELEYINGL